MYQWLRVRPPDATGNNQTIRRMAFRIPEVRNLQVFAVYGVSVQTERKMSSCLSNAAWEAAAINQSKIPLLSIPNRFARERVVFRSTAPGRCRATKKLFVIAAHHLLYSRLLFFANASMPEPSSKPATPISSASPPTRLSAFILFSVHRSTTISWANLSSEPQPLANEVRRTSPRLIGLSSN